MNVDECLLEIRDFAEVNEYKWLLDDLEVITEALLSNDTPEMDIVENPNHYNIGGFNATEVMSAVFGVDKTRDFFLLSAFKYLFRHQHKNREEDILKARRCLNIWHELGNGESKS